MAKSHIQTNVTQVLRTLMAAHGRTQGDVAGALGITQSAVSNKMSGRVSWSLEDLEWLSVFFGLPSPQVFLQDPRLIVPHVPGLDIDPPGEDGSSSSPKGRPLTTVV